MNNVFNRPLESVPSYLYSKYTPSLKESSSGLMSIIRGNKTRRMQPTKKNIHTFTCDDYSSLCSDLDLTENLKNLIKFYLTKGTCSSLHFIRGKRNVSIYEKFNTVGVNLGIFISFNDLEFELKDIEYCSSKTSFLSYKQLKALHEKLMHSPKLFELSQTQINNQTRTNRIKEIILPLLIDSIFENPINRSNNINLSTSKENENIFFTQYNKNIIQSHAPTLTEGNRFSKITYIQDMVCNIDNIPFVSTQSEGGKKKTTRKRSSSTSSRKSTSTKKKTSTTKKKTTTKKKSSTKK